MRTSWPTAFALAVSAHVGVVGAVSLLPQQPDQHQRPPSASLELNLDVADAVSEPSILPESPPIRPPEPVVFAATDPAMPPAESLPATSVRAKSADLLEMVHELRMPTSVLKSLVRVPAELDAWRIRTRAIADAVRVAAPDGPLHWPSHPHSPVQRQQSSADSTASGAGPTTDPSAATTLPSSVSSSAAEADLQSDVAVSRGPVPAGGNTPPPYPAEAVRQRVEGIVTVRLLVGPSGEVLDASVVQSSGSSLLDAAALTATRGWRFVPATDSLGRGVECQANVPITFRLRK